MIYEGYHYHKNRTNRDSTIIWCCPNRNCKGRIKTQNNNVIVLNPHNHAPLRNAPLENTSLGTPLKKTSLKNVPLNSKEKQNESSTNNSFTNESNKLLKGGDLLTEEYKNKVKKKYSNYNFPEDLPGYIIDGDDLKLRHPFNMLIGGASQSGKTEWVLNFLKHRDYLIDTPMNTILYCYGVYTSKIPEIQSMGVETHEGIPSEVLLKYKKKPMLLILDDLMMDVKSDFLNTIFTRGSHHWNMSIVFVTQYIFTKELKTARGSCHYLVLLRNPSGELQTRNLGLQLFPNRLNYFLDAYKRSTVINYGYLLIDLHPSSPEILRLRTNIFPPNYPVAFLPK